MKTIIVLLISMICAVGAKAQTSDWQNMWNETLAGARKEGKVVVASNADPVMRKEIIPTFTARYGIPVEFIAGGSGQLASRVRLERAAGIYSIDVYMSGTGTTIRTLYPEKMIDPLKPLLILPEVTDGSKWKRGRPWFIDREREYVLQLFYTVDSILLVNTDYVKSEEMRNIHDLLDPKWTGKIVTVDPTSASGSGAGNASRFLIHLGPEFIKKLYINQKPIFSRDLRQMADWLARGTYPICIGCNVINYQDLQQEGFKFREIYKLDGMKSSTNPSPFVLSVANKAPHLNAASIFINWIATQEALDIYARASGAATLRTDVDESFLIPDSIPKEGVEYMDETDIDWIERGRTETGEKVTEILRR